ncbi:MAG: tRNA (adenosine(37)-N6)-dimethylallyltransferase MiaA [Deltaproteobacteria bacterium]|jgi:tRNA dimethylallyltransferase|nr:tRNA (adenosine(37)-N6)-dimethylallyltransferase MiaA [Deltaproteobacteria bacterium]
MIFPSDSLPQTRVICVGGPTGAGKSAAAVFLARQLNGAVVNVDSRQMYADFPIITAQPGAEDLRRCPHHLYGFLPSGEKMGAGRYVQLAGKKIAALASTGQTAVLTGGTGLFFNALLRGIADIPGIDPLIRQKWQERWEREGSGLYACLQRQDPDYAAKIHPRDRQRITRALEVCEGTGRKFSWWHKHRTAAPEFRALFFGVGRPLNELEPVLKARIDLMLERGAVEEAEAAMRKCADRTAPGWSGIGCAELFAYITGQTDLESCKKFWQANTRAYAKRQWTWFRADKSINWFAPGEHEKMLDKAGLWLKLP